jgi:hypothetical protein
LAQQTPAGQHDLYDNCLPPWDIRAARFGMATLHERVCSTRRSTVHTVHNPEAEAIAKN